MADWQDISTAPKDGTILLLLEPRELTGRIGHDHHVVGRWVSDKRFQAGGHWEDAETHTVLPTHWQPLPAPPGTEQPAASEHPASVDLAALSERLLKHAERGHMIDGDEPFDWWLSRAQQLLREAASALGETGAP